MKQEVSKNEGGMEDIAREYESLRRDETDERHRETKGDVKRQPVEEALDDGKEESMEIQNDSEPIVVDTLDEKFARVFAKSCNVSKADNENNERMFSPLASGTLEYKDAHQQHVIASDSMSSASLDTEEILENMDDHSQEGTTYEQERTVKDNASLSSQEDDKSRPSLCTIQNVNVSEQGASFHDSRYDVHKEGSATECLEPNSLEKKESEVPLTEGKTDISDNDEAETNVTKVTHDDSISELAGDHKTLMMEGQESKEAGSESHNIQIIATPEAKEYVVDPLAVDESMTQDTRECPTIESKATDGKPSVDLFQFVEQTITTRNFVPEMEHNEDITETFDRTLLKETASEVMQTPVHHASQQEVLGTCSSTDVPRLVLSNIENTDTKNASFTTSAYDCTSSKINLGEDYSQYPVGNRKVMTLKFVTDNGDGSKKSFTALDGVHSVDQPSENDNKYKSAYTFSKTGYTLSPSAYIGFRNNDQLTPSNDQMLDHDQQGSAHVLESPLQRSYSNLASLSSFTVGHATEQGKGLVQHGSPYKILSLTDANPIISPITKSELPSDKLGQLPSTQYHYIEKHLVTERYDPESRNVNKILKDSIIYPPKEIIDDNQTNVCRAAYRAPETKLTRSLSERIAEYNSSLVYLNPHLKNTTEHNQSIFLRDSDGRIPFLPKGSPLPSIYVRIVDDQRSSIDSPQHIVLGQKASLRVRKQNVSKFSLFRFLFSCCSDKAAVVRDEEMLRACPSLTYNASPFSASLLNNNQKTLDPASFSGSVISPLNGVTLTPVTHDVKFTGMNYVPPLINKT